MSRLDAIFSALRGDGKRALMPFICGGFPSLESTGELIVALDRAGASVIEVGIPFSDPIADGAVIAGAMHEALARGVTPTSVLSRVAEVRGRVACGLVAMVSVSIVHRTGGPTGFVGAALQAGFDGLIVPDLPVEEAGELASAAKNAGLGFTLLIAPTTSLARADKILAMSTGFVYVLARSGITGEREGVPDLSGRIARIRQMSPLPVAVGFGISNREQVRAVVRDADAAIVGSALVRRIGEASTSGADPVQVAEAYVRDLACGLGTSPS